MNSWPPVPAVADRAARGGQSLRCPAAVTTQFGQFQPLQLPANLAQWRTSWHPLAELMVYDLAEYERRALPHLGEAMRCEEMRFDVAFIDQVLAPDF